jgi:prophage antirepressor-like protein
MSIELFEFQNQAVRVVLLDDEPWFVLNDLCTVLEIANPRNVAARIDSECVRLTDVLDGRGLSRSTTVVNEAGMYEVVFRSDKREAVEFRRWVTGTVLPHIRRTGSFNAQPELTDDQIIHRALTVSAARIAELEPKAQFYDELMDADGMYTFNAAAKMLGWGRNVMLKELRRLGVVQGNRLPYQRYAKHFKVVPGTYTHPNTGELIPTATTYVLPSGIAFLRKKLAGALELAVSE